MINCLVDLRFIPVGRGSWGSSPFLSDFTPQELITELRARGYEGQLTYTEVKVHKIKL